MLQVKINPSLFHQHHRAEREEEYHWDLLWKNYHFSIKDQHGIKDFSQALTYKRSKGTL